MNKKILFKGPLEKPLSKVPQYLWIAPKLEVMIFEQEGKPSVFPSLCPHMGAQMEVNGKNIECPWHGLAFCTEHKTSTHPRYRRVDHFPAEVSGNEIIIYEKN